MSNEPGTNSDLCWYNTLSGDFSSEKGLHKPNASRKRQPFGLEDVHKDDVSATTADSTSTDVEGYLSATSVPNKLLGSPTKRRRPSTKGNSHTQTPTKPRNIAGNADNTSPIGTGIQTPPPSSTGTTRKHGRSSKCVSSASTSSTDLISPPQTSPTKASAIGVPRTRVPVNRPARRLDRIGRSVPSRPASPIHDNAVERALPHTNLDWSLLRGEISTLSAPLNTSCDESSPSTEDLVDSVAFSFTQSSDFECLPRGVDPNLIFYSSTESVSSSMTDGCNNAVSSFLGIPYHHQYMHQQREEQRRLRKRQGSSSYKGPETHAAKDGLARRCADRSTLPGIRPSSRQSRNEVVLNISPRGRAKAEKTVVLESDTEIEDGLVNTTSDSFDESDSSFDDDIPRGLGPDGSEYISFRRRRAAQKHRSNPGAEIESRENTCPNNTLPTPTRRVAAFAMSAAAAATRTGYESSPRLPTPMRSSPPATLSRSSASFINKKLSLKDMQILYNYATNSDDESEAETVVDESVDFPGDADDGDAVTALRRVMGAGRPRCSVGETTPTKPRSGSTIHRNGNTVTSSKYSEDNARHCLSPVKRKLFDASLESRGEGCRTETPDDTHSTMFPSGESSASNEEGTRCVCGREDDAGLTMVQCDSCKNWLHIKCIGHSEKSLPYVYVCAFCISETRSRRVPARTYLPPSRDRS